LCIGKPKDLGTLAAFFELRHLKKVVVAVISQLIINPKKFNFMEIVKAEVVKIIINSFLTFLSIILMHFGGGVGIAGGSVNQLINLCSDKK
jgi:hypothetical protein